MRKPLLCIGKNSKNKALKLLPAANWSCYGQISCSLSQLKATDDIQKNSLQHDQKYSTRRMWEQT
jgi:hypothetical protein